MMRNLLIMKTQLCIHGKINDDKFTYFAYSKEASLLLDWSKIFW